jgi:hypothetical protein
MDQGRASKGCPLSVEGAEGNLRHGKSTSNNSRTTNIVVVASKKAMQKILSDRTNVIGKLAICPCLDNTGSVVGH